MTERDISAGGCLDLIALIQNQLLLYVPPPSLLYTPQRAQEIKKKELEDLDAMLAEFGVQPVAAEAKDEGEGAANEKKKKKKEKKKEEGSSEPQDGTQQQGQQQQQEEELEEEGESLDPEEVRPRGAGPRLWCGALSFQRARLAPSQQCIQDCTHASRAGCCTAVNCRAWARRALHSCHLWF